MGMQGQSLKGGSMDSIEEKRKITRVDYPIRAHAAYQGELFQGEIKNISLNSLLFKPDGDMSVSVQERVFITVDWNGLGSLVSTIDCIVARNTGSVLGLRFSVIDGDTLMLLREKLTAKAGDRINQEFIRFMWGSK
jgi:PilZ domain.